MKILSQLIAQMHDNGGGLWMFGHWGGWLFWIVILLLVVYIVARFAGRGKDK